MKLITLNTHSLIEEHYEEKLHAFAEVVRKEKPDILITDAIRFNHNARYSFMTIDDFIDMGLRSSDEKKYYIENLCVAFSLLQ